MPTEQDFATERAAQRNLDWALEHLSLAVPLLWGRGDGCGGYILDLIRTVVVNQGEYWPFDPTPAAPRGNAKISRSLAKRVHEKYAYRCVTCGAHEDLCCDHIVPESKGGPTTFENLQSMCRPCNSRKGNREA